MNKINIYMSHMGHRENLNTRRRNLRPAEWMGSRKGLGRSIREDPSELQTKASWRARYWVSWAASCPSPGGHSTSGSALQPPCFWHVLRLHLLLNNNWRMDPGFKGLCSKPGVLSCSYRRDLQCHHLQCLAISDTESSNSLHVYPLHEQAPSQNWLGYIFLFLFFLFLFTTICEAGPELHYSSC